MARILVVDDEPDIRMFIDRALRMEGHEIVLAVNGFDALNALKNDSFDLMLSDIAMPEMDGISLSLQVERDHPDLKILLMTGFAHERQRAHNLDVLVHEVMTKPFDIKMLVTRVNGLLG